jgi:hypothetical protein
MTIQLTTLPTARLLKLHAEIAEELKARGVTRTANNPVGDLAEYLFCKAFGWTQSGNSNPNIDAICNGIRYQIKGRRWSGKRKARQLGAIRDFAGKHFDFLAAVIFASDYSIYRAALIPYGIVERHATFIAHTNSHKFMLHDEIWEAEGVEDVTEKLRAVAM